MKLLIIITPFTPYQTPNTIRWTSLIDYFLTKGIEVSVLTTQVSSDLMHQTNNKKYKIYRAGYNTLLDWTQDKFSSKTKRGLPKKSGTPIIPTRKNSLVERIVDFTWRKNYWPDGSKLFLKKGIKKGNEIVTSDGITHILSVGLPFTCHWIAYHLKEQFSNLHWHQDIEDPFSYSDAFWVNNFKKYKEKNIDAERKAFQLSDSISVTNERAMEKYKEMFSDSAHKLSVIYPIFSGYNQKSISDLIINNEKLHLGYFGSFYTGVRSPEPFLEMLQYILKHKKETFGKFHFHFFGLQNKYSLPIFEKFDRLSDHITLHGFYDRDRSMYAIKQMDVLLNFGNSTDYHLPSKVVDYLYCNKPIVNIHSIENDSSKNFFSIYSDILNLNTESNSVGHLSKSFLEFVSKQRESTSPDIGKVEAYRNYTIGDKYLDQMTKSL